MKLCPYCAEEIQDAAIVCKHCGRDLAPEPAEPAVPAWEVEARALVHAGRPFKAIERIQEATNWSQHEAEALVEQWRLTPTPSEPAGQPTPHALRLGLARGSQFVAALALVCLGFVLCFVPQPFATLGVLLAWSGLGMSLVNAGCVLRWVPSLILAILVAMPGYLFRSAWEARQTRIAQERAQQKVATAARLREEKAKAASEEAARAFPERQASMRERLVAIEGATKGKDWATAQKRLQELQAETAPLFTSTIGQSPEVSAIKARLEAQQAAVSKHAKEQQEADAKKQAAEATRAKAAESAATDRRLFLENHAPDDSARNFIFRSALRSGGQRCDDVTSATMGAPGRWSVACSPGYGYSFRFDGNGKLIGASRLY